MARTGCWYIVVFFAFFTAYLPAQDEHLTGDGLGLLYARSAFAHGYIHGYEMGFHHGDMDLQLGRPPRDPASISSYKRSGASYEGTFGSKSLFKSGFEDGFLAGYSDAVSGESFRAVATLRTAAQTLVTRTGPSQFDHGFKDGYVTGRLQGAQDARALIPANPVQEPCLGKKADYCDAFSRAFQMGYSDGFTNQSGTAVSSRKLQAKAGK